MSFRLKQGSSIDSEVRRIADKQLQLAISALRGIGDRKSDAAVHEARRHVKKIRALIRLMEPVLGRSYRGTNKRLRAVNRLLAPIADGEAVVDTLGRLGKRYRQDLPRPTLASMRKALHQQSVRVDQQARADQVLRNAVALLRAERTPVQSWKLTARGFGAIAPGLRKSVRGARRGMALAIAHPTIEHYHSWRRRVKDHWFQVRLLEGRCGDELIAAQRGLEALDGCLGEYHNCALLQQVLVAETLRPRDQTARTLRMLRKYQKELRREAHDLAAQMYQETSRQFVKRVRRLWRSSKDAAPAAPTRASWPRAA
jgi:CHAD domain-containing protein